MPLGAEKKRFDAHDGRAGHIVYDKVKSPEYDESHGDFILSFMARGGETARLATTTVVV